MQKSVVSNPNLDLFVNFCLLVPCLAGRWIFVITLSNLLFVFVYLMNGSVNLRKFFHYFKPLKIMVKYFLRDNWPQIMLKIEQILPDG